MTWSKENCGGTGPAHIAAFEMLAAYIEAEILNEHTEVTTLSKLCSLYRNWLEETGVEKPVCRTYRVKARLISHFDNRLCFHRPARRTESEFVFSSDAPRGPIIERCINAEREVDASEMHCLHWRTWPIQSCWPQNLILWPIRRHWTSFMQHCTCGT